MARTSQTGKTFVSIALATYNGEAFLAAQLDSILSQTYSHFEIIIIDDGSTDNTGNVLNEYRLKDDRISIFYNEENIGYRDTFYKALLHCKGEYVFFCDQDDIWVSSKIETLLSAIGENLLVFSDSALVDQQGIPLDVKLSDTVIMLQPGEPLLNRGFIIGNCVWGHSIMFHQDLLKYTTLEKNTHAHDWWFAVVASHLNKIKYCPVVLNYYRQHEKNLTRAIPVKTGKVKGRHIAEFEIQLSRINSIAALPFNKDRSFYLQWQQLFKLRKQKFSFLLLKFLLVYRKDIFCLKRKNIFAQLVEIRKMCRKTG
ncbi:MAG: glycosyltransferase family 2 protein, partial [Ferruginibacter sp.]